MILDAQHEIYTMIKDSKDMSTVKITDYETELQPYIQAILDSDTNYQNTLANLEKEKSNADLNHQIAQIQLEEYKSYGSKRQREMQELVVQQNALAMEQADIKINDTKTQYSAQINSQLSQISSQLDEIEANLEKYRLSKEYQNITSPVDGYVNSVAVNTLGETVTSAQDMVTIVPVNTPVEMVCYVKNMDIADIETGMEAEIKLEAYSYNKYGTVKGTVKHISPSSFSSEQLGSVYLVKINITDIPKGINLTSGLSGSVEIKTGKRTVMSYFLDPIIKGFGESLKEK